MVPASPLAQTVAAFAQALLAGSGDLTPLLSPGAHLDPITAPPYAQVQVVQVTADRAGLDGHVPADGTTARVLVQLTATDHAGTAWPYTYALTLRTRAGRWEVAAVDPTPQQAAQPAGRPAASPAPSGS
ncbi:hypothetical protein [Streptacidiphilus monticola]|uniref:Conjugal transfer protein n=1 Tax=Streptacidiphilus monticola TaxID=2161674 RepID=A0ABW1FVA7_9ACTN